MMTRDQLLKHIATTHGSALAQVGMTPADTQECLSYVIDDALRMSNDEKRKAEADRRTAILIEDRRQMLGVEGIEPQPDAEENIEVENVSNE